MPSTKSDCMPEEAAVDAEKAAAPEEKAESIEEEKTSPAKEASAFGASKAIGIVLLFIAALAVVYMMVQHVLKPKKAVKKKK